MEKNAIFNLRVNTGASDADINKTTKATEGLTKATKDANKENQSFESRLSSLNDQVKAGDFSMREASKMIREYQAIALQAGRESPVGREAIMQAAALQDKITDLRNEVTRLSQDGQAMQGAMAIGQTTLAGYTAFQGITAMLGVENEDLMKTMVKMQAAQSVLLSVEQIRKSLEKESVLRLTLINIQTKAAAVGTALYAGAQAALTTVIGTTTGALKLLRIALVATGLGAIVVGIGLVIANFDKLKDTIIGVIDSALKPLMKGLQMLGIIDSDETKQIKKNAEERAKAIQKENQKRLAEINNSIKQTENLRNTVSEYYDHEIAKARAAGKDVTQLEQTKRAELRKTYEEAIRLKILLFEEEKKTFKGMMKLIPDIGKEAKALRELDKADEIAAIQAKHKRGSSSAKKEVKQVEDKHKKILEMQRAFEDLMLANIADQSQREILTLITTHDRQRQEMIEKYGKDTEILKQLETHQANELAALKEKQKEAAKAKQTKEDEEARAKAIERAELELDRLLLEDSLSNQARLDAQLAFEEEKFQLLLNNSNLSKEEIERLEIAHAQKLKDINQEKIDDEEDTAEAIRVAKMSVLDQSIGIVSALGALGKEGGAFAKAMALTEIAASTAIGFAKGLVIAQQSAQATGPAAAFAFPAFYAGQIAAVLAAAGQARKVLGTGPNIGGTGGGGGISAPSAQTAPQMNTRDVSQGTNTQQQSTTMVAVLESDITNTQRRISDIEVRTTF